MGESLMPNPLPLTPPTRAVAPAPIIACAFCGFAKIVDEDGPGLLAPTGEIENYSEGDVCCCYHSATACEYAYSMSATNGSVYHD